MIVTTATTIYY